ncbi:hypothetical protein F2Q70_00000181 [Brassica cretica]|uniref:Auxin response factor n=1 Tax=Brassica cretica TaxID=69181 RepID=A0A8S9IW61_BRACR|nr:hypothetical protein F2Q70_00000181 [Brassica cretica]
MHNLNFEVETNSDEVYAKVSLLTCPPEVEILFPNDNNEQNIKYFTKVLTASDISPHGDFILFKKDAIECLPPLDMSQLTPSQEIVAKDLHDHVWKFKHTFRGTPKKHFFTSGWKEFVRGKSLAVGDSFVFLRGENGESRVGIRKAAHQQSDMSSSVISKESMHHGFIASASNAIHTKCMFDVFYKPKSSKFIVNCDKFLDAVTRKFNTSSRFTMKFEGHDFNEITYSGTIVKVEDFSIYWKGSEWRNLQVQWDEAATIPRPNKVSPWEIEPLIPSSNIFKGENGESRVGIRKAAHQQSDMSSSVISKESMHHGFIASASNAIHTKCMFDVFYKPKSSKFIVNCDKFLDAVTRKFNTSSRFTMKFEGHDFNEITYSGTIVKVEDFSIYWKGSEWRNLQVQWDEAATIPRPNKVSPWEIEPLIPSSNIFKSVIRKNKRQREINEFVSNAGPIMSKPDYNHQMVQSTKENSTTNASSSFRLFGVDLTASSKARDALEPLESYQKNKISEIFEEEKLDQIQAVTSLTEIQRKEISFTTSSTKVHMESVVKTVDLTVFDGYNHMIVELEKLFNIEGKLHMHSQWKLTFKVHEGDMMLVGDDLWPSSKFIVNCDKFLDAVTRKFNTSSRFTMKFEGHDFNEITYSGTIVKVEDFSIYWKGSEWRNLQVQWDEAATIPRPNKVSPWEIEPLIPSSNIFKSVIRKNKRQREINEFVSYAGPIMSKPDYNHQMVQSTKENSTTNASSSFRLFGVDLTASSKARDVLEPLESYQKNKISEIFEEEKLDQIQAVTSVTEIQRKEISFTTSSTKVHMESVVKTVDLTVFDGYNHMIVELEKLFNIEGKLHMHSQWKLTFKVHEGDMMLVGDDLWPWEELEGFRVGGELELRIVESRRGVLPGLKTAVPYDYIDVSSGSGWDQVLKKAEEELRNEN